MNNGKDMTQKENNPIEKTRALRSVVPWVDIYENEDEILVHADMPGVTKEEISVNIDNGTLSISGVRRFEHKGASKWKEFDDVEYTRKFSIPQTIDVEQVKAELKDGVLKLHLPKSEAAKPKMIEIKAA